MQQATAALPAAIATQIADGAPKKRRVTGGGGGGGVGRAVDEADGGGDDGMQDVAVLAAAAMGGRKPETVEIMFAPSTPSGQHVHHINVLGARPSVKPLPFAWPAHTDACCLHCSDPIHGPPLPAVVQRNARTGVYTPAEALFCSVGCALAWLRDDFRGPEKSNAIAWTRDVLVRYFGCAEPMHAAPPRVALAKYSHVGKGMDRATFTQRPGPQGQQGHVFVKRCDPPFVTVAAVFECLHRELGNTVALPPSTVSGNVRGIRRPTVRTDPIATRKSTGRPPLILAFAAAKARQIQHPVVDYLAPPLHPPAPAHPPSPSSLPPPSLPTSPSRDAALGNTTPVTVDDPPAVHMPHAPSEGTAPDSHPPPPERATSPLSPPPPAPLPLQQDAPPEVDPRPRKKSRKRDDAAVTDAVTAATTAPAPTQTAIEDPAAGDAADAPVLVASAAPAASVTPATPPTTPPAAPAPSKRGRKPKAATKPVPQPAPPPPPPAAGSNGLGALAMFVKRV